MSVRSFFGKILSLLFPILVVIGVLGGALWILMSTYFWNTARFTIYLPTGEPTVVQVETRARLIYRDLDLYGFFQYPLHVTFPWSRTYQCVYICVVPSVPAGDGVLTIRDSGGEQKMPIFFAADTDGFLDLRPKLTITPLEDAANLNVTSISETERARVPGDILWENDVERVVLFREAEGGTTQLYDIVTRQVVPLSTDIVPSLVARGEQDGTYYLWNGDMHLYDRYGRATMTTLSELPFGEFVLSWGENVTLLRIGSDTEEVRGIWWPFGFSEGSYITNGKNILKISPVLDPSDSAEEIIKN